MKRQQRILFSALGVAVGGVSVGLFRVAELGVDPFQSLMSGLEAVVPIRFGTLYLLVNAALLVFSLLLDRRKIGLATLINLTLYGYVVEWAEGLLRGLLPAPGLPVRLALLGLALVAMCFGTALYFNADLGVSTYDAVSLVISQRQKRVSFRWCRILSDLVCVLAGAALLRLSGKAWTEITASLGPATLLTAFCMGPLISFFSARLPSAHAKS
jgi:uncharacterized membrane protein YczE